MNNYINMLVKNKKYLGYYIFFLGCNYPVQNSMTEESMFSTSEIDPTDNLKFDVGFEHCGDGIIQSDEECDDANNDNDDGCTISCGKDRIVFVSSYLKIGSELEKANDFVYKWLQMLIFLMHQAIMLG